MILQDSLVNSAETVRSAVEGQAGVMVAGSTFVSPGGRNSSDNVDSRLGAAESSPTEQLRFRGLEPSKRYMISLCTESNSGSLSRVTVAEAEAHAEAPLVRPVGYSPRRTNGTICLQACSRGFGGGRRWDASSIFCS